MEASFTVISKEDSQIQVHSDDINWTFTFNAQGHMVDGFELAATLEDEGAALADWAIIADVDDTESFPLAD